jgi:hypothetical protein
LTGTYIPTGFTIQTQELDLSEADDESTISVGYVAYDRPNRFNIYGNGMLIEDSGWVGADNTYSGPWGTAGSLTDPDGTGSFTFTYQSGVSYELSVDVGPANPLADPAYPSDGWSVTFTCLGMPTPTPTLTPNAPTTATLNWNYFETGGADGQMVLYINGSVVENRYSESSGTFNVSEGDTINCEVITNGCLPPNGTANSYTLCNRPTLVDATSGTGNCSLFGNTYTVVSGDLGTTITLSMYSACDSGSV